jgi:glycosyltransferase involved in cell wall biosynthesis
MTTVNTADLRSAGPRTAIRAVQIGMTATTKRRGGLDRYFFSLTQALPAQGVDVTGLVTGDPADLEPGERAICFAPEQSGMLARWRGMRGTLPRTLGDCDVVVSHFAPFAFGALDAIAQHPFCVHFHGPWALEGAAEGAGLPSIVAKRLLERLVYARAARLIVLSRAFASILQRDYGVPADKIRIVPGGVDVERFAIPLTRSAARTALGWPTNRPIVLSVRRLVRAKGLENLIDAIVAVRARVPDVLVIIAGTGPLEADLKRRVRERQLDESVRFTGFVAEADLPTMYRAADLFVVPTIALEGFGLVVLEALACGTPAIVTPIAGLPEVIADLGPQLVLDDPSAPYLARGISDALTGALPLPSDAECIAYARRFAWPTIAARAADVYREAIAT